MRIAFFCTRFPTISETFVLNQLAGLLDAGCTIDIHAIRPGEDAVLQPIFKQYNLGSRTFYRGRMTSTFVRLILTVVLILQYGLLHPRKLLALYQVVRETPEISFSAALFTLRGLRSQPDADVIYAHFGPNGQAVATLKAAGFVSAPLVTVFHGFDVTILIKKWGPEYYRTLFAHGDLMLPVSQEFKNRLESFGCPPEKIKVHHMGVDIQTLDFASRSLSDGEIVVLSIARLVDKKGIKYGIDAINRLKTKGRKIRYVIVGDGPLRAALEEQITSLECADVVDLVGWKNQDEVVEFVRTSHVYLAPSVTAANGDEEGIPVVLMEAAASGLPLISTRHSGIPELVRDHKTGLLADEHSVDDIEEALKSILADPGLTQERAMNARRLVEDEFEINALNSQLKAILEEAQL